MLESVRRLALLLPLVLALAGCGSPPAADLPPPRGRRLAAAHRRPAGVVGAVRSSEPNRHRAEIDRAATGCSSTAWATCREPIAVAMVERGEQIAVLCGASGPSSSTTPRTLKRLGAGAGIGPTALATDGVELLYVDDMPGDALLVYHPRPRSR